jgi:RNA polymerase sigma-70 factor (ECF subfamily)
MEKRQKIDLSLIEQAKKGNQAAYNSLFKHYHGFIRYAISNLVYNTADAEDLTMIAFQKAFSKLDKYTPIYEFNTWLSVIAKNTAIDFLIAKKRNILDYVEEITDTHYPTKNKVTPEDEIINKEIGIYLEKGINRLNDKHKKVIQLRYIDGLSCDELAEKLNIRGNTARGQLLRARMKLLEIMKIPLPEKTDGQKISYFKS